MRYWSLSRYRLRSMRTPPGCGMSSSSCSEESVDDSGNSKRILVLALGARSHALFSSGLDAKSSNFFVNRPVRLSFIFFSLSIFFFASCSASKTSSRNVTVLLGRRPLRLPVDRQGRRSVFFGFFPKIRILSSKVSGGMGAGGGSRGA